MFLFARSTLLAVLCPLVVLTGCKQPASPEDAGATDPCPTLPDAGTEPADAGTQPLAYTELCNRLAEIVCNERAACTCPGPGADAGACLQVEQPSCERSLAGPIAGVALGRLQFVASEAEGCLADYAVAVNGCRNPMLTRRSLHCAQTFLDPAALGGRCAAFSRGWACAGNVGTCGSTGECEPPGAEGQPCVQGRCAEGLACDGTTCRIPLAGPCQVDATCPAGAVCRVDGTCGSPAPLGSPCRRALECEAGLACLQGTCGTGLDAGTACEGSESCGGELTCVEGLLSRTCLPLAGAGESCAGGPETCAEGLACDASNALLPVCVAFAVEGASCLGTVPCAPGFGCDTAGLCAPLPDVGQACSGTCKAGLGCNAQGLCEAPGGDGTPCVGGVCAPGAVCDYNGPTPTCRTRRSQGGDCGSDDACAPGLFCDLSTPQGTCQPQRSAGAECTRPLQCAAGLECQDDPASNTGTCRLMPELGEACTYQCAAGTRCGGPTGQCAAGVCTGP